MITKEMTVKSFMSDAYDRGASHVIESLRVYLANKQSGYETLLAGDMDIAATIERNEIHAIEKAIEYAESELARERSQCGAV